MKHSGGHTSPIRETLKSCGFKELIVICIAVLILPTVVKGQFIYLSMEVETELSASKLEDLDFGTIPVQSGETGISLGEPGMGVFELKGMRYQKISITMDRPDKLHHTDQAIDASIPIHLEFAYNNRGQNNTHQATRMDKNYTPIIMLGREGDYDEPHSEFLNSGWARSYIYVYGSIEIGNVPAGTYKNEVTVTIEY